MPRVTAAEELRAAFDEGFSLSKFGGPIEQAWTRSDARQAAAIAEDLDAQVKLWNFVTALAALSLVDLDPRFTLTHCITNARKLVASMKAPDAAVRDSAQPCGCDAGAGWTCARHRSEVQP